MYIQQRTCIACRTKKTPDELIRITYNKQTNRPEPDCESKADGRGAYICPDLKCIAKAKKKHVIERHLKCEAYELLYSKLEGMI